MRRLTTPPRRPSPLPSTPWPPQMAMLIMAVLAIIAVAATHYVALSFGLRYDDYMFLRPISVDDVRSMFTGSWAPAGAVIDPYFRPLASLYQANLFNMFGLHARPMHVVSLIELAVVVWMVAVFLWRDGGQRAAVMGALIYVLHPVLPDSTSAWIFNQMHLVALIIVMSALLIWQSRRASAEGYRWTPIFALTIVGVLVKEDTAMLLPALLLLQWARAKVIGDVPVPTKFLLATSAVLACALVAWRLTVFPHFDIFESGPARSWQSIAQVAAYGPLRSSAAMFQAGAIVISATAFVLTLQAFGAWRASAAPTSPEGWLWIQGLILLVCFSLPIAFVYDIKSTRLHLVVLSASLMLGAGALALLQSQARSRFTAFVTIAFLSFGMARMAALERTALIDRFSPCGDEDLWFDYDTAQWVSNPDLGRWLALKAAACAEKRYLPIEHAMDIVSWPGTGGHTMLVNPTASLVSFALTRTDMDQNDIAVKVVVDGVPHIVHLTPDGTTRLLYRLTPNVMSKVRAAHRIDVTIDKGALPTLSASRVEWRTPSQ